MHYWWSNCEMCASFHSNHGPLCGPEEAEEGNAHVIQRSVHIWMDEWMVSYYSDEGGREEDKFLLGESCEQTCTRIVKALGLNPVVSSCNKHDFPQQNTLWQKIRWLGYTGSVLFVIQSVASACQPSIQYPHIGSFPLAHLSAHNAPIKQPHLQLILPVIPA